VHPRKAEDSTDLGSNFAIYNIEFKETGFPTKKRRIIVTLWNMKEKTELVVTFEFKKKEKKETKKK